MTSTIQSSYGPPTFSPAQSTAAASFNIPTGVAGIGVERTPPASDVGRGPGRSQLPQADVQLMGRILGRTPSAAEASYTVLESPRDLPRAIPGFDPAGNPNHRELMDELSRHNLGGASFVVDGKAYAFVFRDGIRAAAPGSGMTEEQMIRNVGGQEALHATLSAAHDGSNGTKKMTREHQELLGAYYSIAQNPAHVDSELLAYGSGQGPSGYALKRQVASQAVTEAFAANGIAARPGSGTSVGEDFAATLDAVTQQAGSESKSYDEILRTAVGEYVRQNHPGRPVDEGKILDDMRGAVARGIRTESLGVLREYGLGGGGGLVAPP